MSSLEEKKKRLEELRKKKEEMAKNPAKIITNTGKRISNMEKVNEIIKKAEETSKKIIEDDELVRRIESSSADPTDIIAQYGKSGAWKISHFSDTIIGKNVEFYDEEIQCNIYEEVKEMIEEEMEDVLINPFPEKEKKFEGKKKKVGEFTRKAEPNLNPFKSFLNQAEKEEGKGASTNDLPSINIKQEEIKKKLLYSSEIVEFVQKHSKYIERTLGEKDMANLFYADYKGDNEDDDLKREQEDEYDVHDDKPREEKIAALENPISELCNFFDETITFKRVVTDLQWSTKHPEILLAGYSKSEESNINDPHGLVLLWSLALRKKPEFQFTCQSELTTAIFHPFNPKLIIGATYTGQILIWDTRGKSLPVMKTPPGGKYHSHPIYCLSVTGTTNSCNILSISNDGILCTWNTSNFSKATKRMELKAKRIPKTNQPEESNRLGDFRNTNNPYQDDFGVISMTMQENESNNLFIGTDDADIYQVYTHQG